MNKKKIKLVYEIKLTDIFSIVFSIISLLLVLAANNTAREANQLSIESNIIAKEANRKSIEIMVYFETSLTEERINKIWDFVIFTENIYSKIENPTFDLLSYEEQQKIISIYNSLMTTLNKENKYSEELYNEFKKYLEKPSNIKWNEYKDQNHQDNTIYIVPNTGALPKLENIFVKYREEEKKLINDKFNLTEND